MSDSLKYYYLKLKEDFFDTTDMKLLEALPNGYLYSNILLKLYLKALRDDGRLMYKGNIPYNIPMIATITGHNRDVVEKALEVLKEMQFVEVLDNGAIYMMDIHNFIGQSSTEADRIRSFRRRVETEKKMLTGPEASPAEESAGLKPKGKNCRAKPVHPPYICTDNEPETSGQEGDIHTEVFTESGDDHMNPHDESEGVNPPESSELKACANGEQNPYICTTDEHQSIEIRDKSIEIKEKDMISKQIALLWKLYPRKEGKAQALKKIPALIKKHGFEQVKACVIRYAEKVRAENTPTTYIKQGSTFFNGGYMDYMDDNYTEIGGDGNAASRGQSESRYGFDYDTDHGA